ncbi:MAG: hypothetical protein V7K69_08465 [Nostoc sp.]|uniref:hypothetical protein n=1 Tax=Nostoc sp. TaxID=1180 RepID=UPI002FFA6FAC
MKYTYILRVDCGKDKIKIVSDILGVDTNSNNYWEQILIEEALDPPVNFVDRFFKIIEGKYQKLSMVGVHKNDIQHFRQL